MSLFGTEEAKKEMAQQKGVVTLTITMTDTGAVAVTGPINNRLLAYGLLEIAKDVVRETCEAETKRVNPASSQEIAALASAQVKKGS